ncbi:MAG: discoidin domain-containing protein, partial [Acidimicrobiales bacterium]|nr:discoidin domain-containing protein [Acidimicrobiales bacterium]
AIVVGLAACAAFATLLLGSDVNDSSANGAQSLQNAEPRADTPVATDGRVYAGAQQGDRIIVGGTFTSVEPTSGASAIALANMYVFDVNTGTLDPHQFTVNDRVSVVIAAAEDDHVFVGGSFSDIDGTARHKLAKLDLDAGVVDPVFVAHTNAQVKDLVLVGNTLYLTGGFTEVNDVPRLGLAAVDATTGEVRDDFDFPLETYIGQVAGTAGQRIGATPDGSTLVVMHRAKFVGGQERRGVAMIDIGTSPPALLPWQTDFWDATSVVSIVDGEVSPDGTYLVVSGGWGDSPPWRDTATAFPVAGGANTQPLWVTRNHDSTFALGIDNNAVYIGGHFCWTEGPTTAEPWGNPAPVGKCPNKTRNDPTEVYRDTFAALDPATGKAIKYAPDTDARNGIRSIEVIPAGLLVGGDQTWTADVRTGRMAFFDIRDAREDLALSGSATQSSTWSGYGPELAIDANRDKQLFTGTIAATENETQPWWEVDLGASHDISEISLWTRTDCCQDEFSDVWVFTSNQPFASTDPAVLAGDPNVDATLLAGPQDRKVTVQAWTQARYVRVQLDGQGQLFLSEVVVYQNTGTGPDDTVAPSVVFATPADGAVEPGPDVELVGSIGDDVAVGQVLVGIRDRNTGDWLRSDGSFGAWHQFEASVLAPGSSQSDWSLTVQLPPGSYSAFVNGSDQAGNSSPEANNKFLVGLDDQAPQLVVDTPAADAELPAGTIVLGGTATDDTSVGSVLIAIRDRDSKQWLQPDGTWGAWTQLEAQLAEPGEATTGWSLTVELAPG